jgi:hypothetical protein
VSSPKTIITLLMPAEGAARILADPKAALQYLREHGFPEVESIEVAMPEDTHEAANDEPS